MRILEFVTTKQNNIVEEYFNIKHLIFLITLNYNLLIILKKINNLKIDYNQWVCSSVVWYIFYTLLYEIANLYSRYSSLVKINEPRGSLHDNYAS